MAKPKGETVPFAKRGGRGSEATAGGARGERTERFNPALMPPTIPTTSLSPYESLPALLLKRQAKTTPNPHPHRRPINRHLRIHQPIPPTPRPSHRTRNRRPNLALHHPNPLEPRPRKPKPRHSNLRQLPGGVSTPTAMSPLPRWERARVRVIGGGRRAGCPPLAGEMVKPKGETVPFAKRGGRGSEATAGGARGERTEHFKPALLLPTDPQQHRYPHMNPSPRYS